MGKPRPGKMGLSTKDVSMAERGLYGSAGSVEAHLVSAEDHPSADNTLDDLQA